MSFSEKISKIIFIFILVSCFVLEGTYLVALTTLAQNQIDSVVEFLPDDPAPVYYLEETTAILNEVNQRASNKSEQATVALVGDMMFSRTVNDKMKSYDNYFYPLEALADFLAGADLTFGNLESPIFSGKHVPPASYNFDAAPAIAANLARAGFDVVSLANNHAGNAGAAGFLKSFEELNKRDIKYVGAAKNSADLKNQGVITEINGVKIGWLAYAYGPSQYRAGKDSPGMALMDKDQLKSDVLRLKDQVDHVFVSMHAGDEYTENISAQQSEFAHLAIDSGASLVIGHHPHVVQRFESYGGGYIFYSLGNFIFDQMWSENTRRGLAVKVFLDKQAINTIEFYPIKIFDFAQPKFSFGSDQQDVLDRLKTDLGRGLAADINHNKINIALSARQVFSSRPELSDNFLSADINGNAIPEYFYLINEKAYIIEDGRLRWQSFPDWQVKKIFLSDANADSRLDFNLILEKSDFMPSATVFNECQQGSNGCHWFIYGWRRGSWQPYWDSSRIYPPILDIEQVEPGLFLILESNGDTENLTLWKWNNWTFDLIDEISELNLSGLHQVGSGMFLLE
ncbi:MAG: CapA family protein [Patescibacteria group bacterium]